MLITAILIIVLLMLLFGVKAVRFMFWLVVLLLVVSFSYIHKNMSTPEQSLDTQAESMGSDTITSGAAPSNTMRIPGTGVAD